MSARIRRMAARDAERLAELTTQLGYPVDAEATAARIGPLLEDRTSVVLVAADADDRPIGWLHVTLLRGLEDDARVHIMGLVIDDQQRSAGIGHELLAAGEAWAREQGVRRMSVYSRQTRERAHRFYEREGYALVKRSYYFEKELA
ncbi:MAG: GNAT family N-acetyltransferase [Chloroflexota bacterium]